MRTRRGFARHFLLLGATVGVGLMVGAGFVGVSTLPNRQTFRRVHSAPAPQVTTRGAHATELRYFDFRRVVFAYTPPGMTFAECDLREADLRRLELTGSRFRDCDLRGARLDGANLTSAFFTPRTRWPAGFDPEARGARLEE